MDNFSVFNSSLLSPASDTDYSAQYMATKNYALKIGLINAIYLTDSPKNLSKISTEYDVLVLDQSENKATTPMLYRNCLHLDQLGGVADYGETRLRLPTTLDRTKVNKDDGHYVLILCLDGQSTKGIIIGGVAHPNKIKSDYSQRIEVNGVLKIVDKNGDYYVVNKGPTDNNGTPTNLESGSLLQLTASGDFIFSPITIPNYLKNNLITNKLPPQLPTKSDTDYLEFSKSKKSFAIKTTASISTETKAHSTKANILSTEADLSQTKIKKANYTINSLVAQLTKTADIKGQDVNINIGKTLNIRAKTINLNAQSITIGTTPLPAVTSLTSFIGIGNLGAPVISNAIGPFSSSVKLG